MNVLVLNCGSSSLKYRLIEMPSERERAGGEAQRVGPPTAEPPKIFHNVDGRNETHETPMPDHATAFERVVELLGRQEGLIPDVIGHRVVHGGARFSAPAVIDENVLQDLDGLRDLAPIHNPPATDLIHACVRRYPSLPEVAVFDTAFHATLPACASTYALPAHLRDDLGLRKYGFHGISHQYVVEEAARFLERPREGLTAVSCHLGSGGASLCAVRDGRSVDNSMGVTPLQGLVMSTRCGDLDPALTLRLLAQNTGDANAVERLLNKESGLLGLSRFSGDIRDLLSRLPNGNEHHLHRALQVYLWRVRKYLGAYLAVVGEADAVIFTDTIGEDVPYVRWAVCADLDVFGLRLDADRNEAVASLPADIAADDSPVRILVIRTNEELAIARHVYATLGPTAHTSTEGAAA